MKKLLGLLSLVSINVFHLEAAHSAGAQRDLDLLALAAQMEDEQEEDLPDIFALDVYNNPQDRDDTLTYIMMENDPSRSTSTRTPQEIKQLRKLARALLKMDTVSKGDKEKHIELFLVLHKPQLPDRKHARPNTFQAFLNELYDRRDTIGLDDSLSTAEQLELLEDLHKQTISELKAVEKEHSKTAQKNKNFPVLSEKKGALKKFTDELHADVTKLRKKVADEQARIRESGRQSEATAAPLKPKVRKKIDPALLTPSRECSTQRRPLTLEDIYYEREYTMEALKNLTLRWSGNPGTDTRTMQSREFKEANMFADRLMELNTLEDWLREQENLPEETDEARKLARLRADQLISYHNAALCFDVSSLPVFKKLRKDADRIALQEQQAQTREEKERIQRLILEIIVIHHVDLQGLDTALDRTVKMAGINMLNHIQHKIIVYNPDNSVDVETSINNLNGLKKLPYNLEITRDLIISYLRLLTPDPSNKSFIDTLMEVSKYRE